MLTTKHNDPNGKLGWGERLAYGSGGFAFNMINGIIGSFLTIYFTSAAGLNAGIIATILDVASGLMALQADKWSHQIVTQNCDIHYLRPASGERLWAEARLIRKGRRVCVVQADCYSSADGRPCATSIYEVAYI